MSRTIVVGDIHGCLDELMRLLERVDLRADDLLVSVGDVVDRGPSPGEVVRFLRERPNTVVLVGNHERKHIRGIFSYAQEITRLQLGGAYDEIVAWMGTLPYHFENEHVRVVHAAMVPGVPLPEQQHEILCGSTSGERELGTIFSTGWWHEHYEGKPVVFGHRVVDEPLVRDSVVFGIDTGACHGGRLTALVAPTLALVSVAARTDHWAETKRRWQLPVLRAKPWRELPWDEIVELHARFRSTTSDEARTWLESLEQWISSLRAMHAEIADAARREVDRLLAICGLEGFTAVARKHLAGPLLFQAKSGRLDAAAIAKACTTPKKTIELASAFGIATPRFP